MNLPDDTIAAVSTPPGEGGIGIVRLSGNAAFEVAQKILVFSSGRFGLSRNSRRIMHGYVIDPRSAEKIDEVLVAFMKAPHTYTREDVVEINCHGGMMPVRRILALVLDMGARLAEPGEFTRRAFLNGRIDLSQAEAVIDIIRAKTDQSERLAMHQLEGRLSAEITAQREAVIQLCTMVEAYIDFPEDEVEALQRNSILVSMQTIRSHLAVLSKSYDEGRLYREGASMAIVGKPNVGKSSLLNAMLKKDRAIVTDLPGTTRDVIEEGLNIGGMPVRIMDTAGIREAHDLAEIEGVKRSLAALEGADIVLAVFDGSRPADDADIEVLDKTKDKKVIAVINKSDIASPQFNLPRTAGEICSMVMVSAIKGDGISELKDRIIEVLADNQCRAGDESAGILITNMRHKQLLDRALDSLGRAMQTFEDKEPLEVTALFLREVLDSLGEIVGIVTTEDILNRIFSEFCIGK
jgi:tRNA modification GTPase